MVEVFKTDVSKKNLARTLVKSLSNQLPGYKINIDLADCDKVLRVEGPSTGSGQADQEDLVAYRPILASRIMSLVKKNGFKCEVLN